MYLNIILRIDVEKATVLISLYNVIRIDIIVVKHIFNCIIIRLVHSRLKILKKLIFKIFSTVKNIR